jgi:hypothetical protein
MSQASNKYQLGALSGLAGVGLMVQLLFGGEYSADGGTGPATAVVWGYGLTAISLLCIMFVSFALTSEISKKLGMSAPAFLMDLVGQAIPLSLLLLVLGWIISLNVTFYKRINQGIVAEEYTPYSRLSTIMIAFQIAVVLKWVNDYVAALGARSRAGTVAEEAKANQLKYVSYILTVLNLVFAGMLTIVLTYFTTDG